MRTLLIIPVLLLATGCVATKGAYQAADSPDETAFVVMEHYNAVLGEAADFVESPTTTAEEKAIIKQVTQTATPLVLELKPLAEAYTSAVAAIEEAEEVDEADRAAVEAARVKLSAALGKASVAVASLIRAVKDVRARLGAGTSTSLEFVGGVT